MSDPLTWSPIRLGRWFGTTVKVHIFLILFVATELLMALLATKAEDGLRRLPQTACWLSLLILALAIHELGHALTAYWLDCDQEDVHLWPLGNLVGPSLSPRSSEHFLVALAGPVTSGALFLGIALGLNLFTGARFVWNPFGNPTDSGAPLAAGGQRAGRAARPDLAHRLVRLPELSFVPGELAAGLALRRRADVSCLSLQHFGGLGRETISTHPGRPAPPRQSCS